MEFRNSKFGQCAHEIANPTLQILVPSKAGKSGPGYKVSNTADKIADKMAEQKQIGRKRINPRAEYGAGQSNRPFHGFRRHVDE